ncbi:MAG: TonB-dependent receptor plug domain-containing protein [Croceibacterium sp.]
MLIAPPAQAQDSGDAPAPVAAVAADGKLVFTPEDFARFAPKTALDMLNQVPGFSVNSEEQGRGLGQASTNVLINGERLALKSESVFDRLNKISATKVVRIEIVDGATLNIPGLSGQVANIIVEGGALSGQFRWETRFRPNYVRPRWFGGSVSINGTAGKVEYTLAVSNPGGRGAARGPTEITDAGGALIEHRETHLAIANDNPKLSGSLKWDGPGTSVGHFNASYQRGFFNLHDDEERTRPGGIDRHRDYDARDRPYNYELGGDFEFALGPGRLKLIGLERYEHSRYSEDAVFIYADNSPNTGGRYASVSGTGEHIARGEYSWKMLGGDWQLAAEAAFNRYNGEAHLFNLDPAGTTFVETPFPNGTGGVNEDRYEAVLTQGRQLASNLSLQIGLGGEYSKLSQTGPMGLTRTFQRPKGSASLSWTPHRGLDLSLRLSRQVGQLSFEDFLARVDLNQNTGNAGNAELVPPQSWNLDFEAKKDLAAWGTTTLKLYGRWYNDYIDFIPLPGGVESRGNIASARNYGANWVSTIKLDPIGFKGAKIDADLTLEDSNLRDPLTGQSRSFSNHFDRRADITLRHDIPSSDWAWGLGVSYNHVQPYYRLAEVGRNYEGPAYTFVFVENKDVFGLAVRAQFFNVTNGRRILDRTVYSGPRDSSAVLFHESRDQAVGPIFDISVRGTF